MTLRTRILRILIGLVVLAVALLAGFSVFQAQMPQWGATPAEAALALPGDEILSAPDVDWTNARTINAPPEQVWPWLAQLGDTRGGFYSFTFIEDRVGAMTGSNYAVNYSNANTIHPEWQNPQPGDQIIQGLLKWDRFESGKWLLASSTVPDVMGWTWLWQITPAADGKGTRLINRIGIQAMAGGDNPVMSFFIGNGAFIMEQRMMNGIKAHAEGWVEPPYQEAVEIVLWFVALLVGIVSAVLFVTRRAWIAPLSLAVASVAVVLVLTFSQPPTGV
ncbi:MAG: hypothetical protein ACM30E_01165, partial [Nitrososphaerales archaeon]